MKLVGCMIGLQKRELKQAGEHIEQQEEKLAQAKEQIDQQKEKLAQAEEQIAEQQEELQQAEEDVNEKNDTIDNLIDNLSKYVAGNVVNKAIHTTQSDSLKCDEGSSNDENAEILDKAFGDDEIEILSIEVESEVIKTATSFSSSLIAFSTT